MGEPIDLKVFLDIATDKMADSTSPAHREPGWILSHGIRTAKITIHLADLLRVDVDRDALYIGAVFHDIGKGKEPHSEIGAQMTRTLLDNLIDASRLDLICDMIAFHPYRNNGSSHPAEVRVVQDADILDHVGEIEAWLGFYWAGSQGQKGSDNKAWIEGDEYAENRKYMREALNFNESKAIYDRRVAWERDFFSEFHRLYTDGI